MAKLAESARPKDRVVIGTVELDRAAAQVGGLIDPVHGGVRGAPKFPQPMLLEFLWRAGERSGEARYFAAVDLTLERICQGGIYDHLGGGFSRYSVDERWLVPHFEKMLYDNAQLLELIALAHSRSKNGVASLAYARSGNALFRSRAEETVGWLTREMTTGRAPSVLRSTLIPRARRENSTSGRSRRSCASWAKRTRIFRASLRCHGGGKFRGPQHPQPSRPRAGKCGRRDAACPLRERLLAARAARARPGSTTRFWPTGTAS